MEAFNYLLKRNIKLFWRNKSRIFFLFLGPLITLFVFFLFVKRNFDNGSATDFLNIKELPRYVKEVIYPTNFFKDISSFLFNVTVISGLTAITAFTTAVQLANNIVHDKETRTLDDFFITPTKTTTIRSSYLVFNIIFNIIISCFTLFVLYIYFYASFSDSIIVRPNVFFSVLGITILSAVTSSLFFVFLFSYVKTNAVFMALSAIFSSIGGFLIGAYYPVSLLPKSFAGVLAFIPQTQAGILIRSVTLDYDFITSTMNQLTYDNVKFLVDDPNTHQMQEYTVLEYYNTYVKQDVLNRASTFINKLVDGINSGIRTSGNPQIAAQDISKGASLGYVLGSIAVLTSLQFIFKFSKKR
ncbi:ABC transporter permease [Mycoplasma sp. E35C]|uniref:ABC transporter permease n=1 Tax=Mycoplasma sp. E35C TaxID=2801918 RepID=UPI001CA46141|nr:ABC transporter permease [Mycoplasma sp. E35C]QZX49446.1 ABC transporter permease [Mycoplasma sp. E35C]